MPHLDRTHLVALARSARVDQLVGGGTNRNSTAEGPLHQLAPGGRLVVPLRLRGAVCRLVAFAPTETGWAAVDHRPWPMPPRRGEPDAGISPDSARQVVALAADQLVTLTVDQDQTVDAHRLAGIVGHAPTITWTGATVTAEASLESLWLWLSCSLPNGLSLMAYEQPAIDAGLVLAPCAAVTMATVADDTLAYLTLRPARGTQTHELGVIGHGPGRDRLVATVADRVVGWHAEHRDQTAEISLHPRIPSRLRSPGSSSSTDRTPTW